MRVSIPRNIIKAMLCAAGKDDIRYYLNGVLCVLQQGFVELTATDGHMMARCRFASREEDSFLNDSAIIPRSVLEAALKLPKSRFDWLVVEVGERSPRGPEDENMGDVKVSLPCMSASVSDKEMDGRFPDWTRVWVNEQDVNYRPAAYAGHLMDALTKIAKEVGGKFPALVLHQNGERAALVQFGGDTNIAAVVMPMRAAIATDMDAVTGLPGLSDEQKAVGALWRAKRNAVEAIQAYRGLRKARSAEIAALAAEQEPADVSNVVELRAAA